MAYGEKIVPIEDNLDIAAEHLGNDKGRFKRNLDFTRLDGGRDGENSLLFKPLPANDLYDPHFTLPIGRNFCIGEIVSRETSDVYVFVWNSQRMHSIYRMRNRKCEFVYIGPELNFQLNPIHFIGHVGRADVITVCKGDKKQTFLCWTDGFNTQRMLCVEDSMATNFFDATRFPRLATNKKEELINLGLAAPWDCIGIKEIKTENSTINKLRFRTWQFRISYIDVYNRPSEHGVISDLYYQSECAGVQASCLELSFDAGGPLVDRIKIEYRRNCTTEWSYHDTLYKYENNQKNWYEKKVNQKITLLASTNKITYKFCADKECVPVTGEERTQNPLPLVSQSLFAMAGGITLAGNTYGWKPWGDDIMDKVHFEVEKPVLDEDAGVIQTRNIVVWGFIYSVHNGQKIQAVWQQGDRTVFGGIDGADVEDRVAGTYRQIFSDKDQGGWLGWLHGTGYTAISKQYKVAGITTVELAKYLIRGGGPLPNADWVEHGVASRDEAGGSLFIQRWEFKNVPPGRYKFRIAHHTASPTSDFQRTSTYFAYVRGTIGNMPGEFSSRIKDRELDIDVCQEDYDSIRAGKMVELWDLTHAKNNRLQRAARVSEGYVYETNEGENGRIPIEGAEIRINVSGDSDSFYTPFTDHNGFYFSTAKDKDHELSVYIKRKCKSEKIALTNFDKSDSSGVKRRNFFATSKWKTFQEEKCNRVIVSGIIKDCSTGIGVQGVSVAAGRAGSVTTNKEGEFSIIFHDHFDDNLRNLERELFIYGGGKCNVTSCNDQACVPAVKLSLPPCTTSCQERVVNLPIITMKIKAEKIAGPQLGGRYGFGLKGADWMDRKTYIQVRPQHYLDIPTANEIGGFAYPRIKWYFDEDVRFPLHIKKLYFNWTENLRFSDFHTWVVDRFELIDNTGNINSITPSQIRVYYTSLNEYNKQNNFSTNSTWQIIDDKDNLKITDQVHFIANGDGKMFEGNITELVKFDRDGRYFHIDYNNDLANLKDGALIKFIREKECKDAEEFFEICQTVDVVDGYPTVRSGYLNVYDSYFVNRQIPTPITTIVKRKKQVQGSDDSIVYEEVEESLTTNTLRSYGWPFEHHSPSDFWGNKCSNRGRVGIVNEYEDVLCKRDELAVSGVIGSNGLVNYLHFFDQKRKFQIGEEWGDIVSGIPMVNRLLLITTSNHCVVPYDDNVVRTGSDGRAVIASGDKQFGKPVNNSEKKYCCKFQDRNTITFDGRLVKWLDSANVVDIVHNFERGVDVSEGKYNNFLRAKIKSVQNSETQRYFHQHINPHDNQSYMTDFDISTPNYINNTFFPQIDTNETYCVDLPEGKLRKFVSFTPEMYAALAGDNDDKQFYSFKDGLPYKHYISKPSAWNRFYGQQCQRVLRISMATDPMKVKDFTAIEVWTNGVKLWSPEVRTGFGQLSRIPRNWFKRGEKQYTAPFLCDVKSFQDKNKGKEVKQNAIFGADKLRGNFVDVLLVGDPDHLGEYSELTGVIIFANGIEKTGT